MEDNRQALRRRLDALTGAQRALLAMRLGVPVKREARPPQGLVAFVSGCNGTAPDQDGMRAFLRERLPEYMLPRTLRVLDELPRTPAGKLDRAALRDVRPDAAAAAIVPARNEKEAILAAVWREVLGVSELGVDDDFFELGGDSLLSIRILARAKQRGLQISPEHFFAYPTVAGQAAAAGEVAGTGADTGRVTGQAPLMPIQHWFLAHIPVEPAHWNQSLLLSIHRRLDDAVIERALQQLLLHHDGLRVHLARDGERVVQWFADLPAALPLTVSDAASLSGDALQAAVASAAARLHGGFDLEAGPLLGAVLFRTGQDEPDRLLLVIHHLLVDAVSWQILVEDLTQLCEQLPRGGPAQLPARTCSVKAWANRLVELAASERIRQQLAWWMGQDHGRRFTTPVDFAGSPADNRFATAETLSLELGAADTGALTGEASQAYRTQTLDLLLTAFATVMARWADADAVLVDLERHGRQPAGEDIDLSRTVGWLTNVFPLWLDGAAHGDPGDRIRSTKETLRAMPDEGMGHGLLRYLSPEAQTRAAMRTLAQAQVCFNFLGRRCDPAGLFTLAPEVVGPGRSPNGQRAYLLDINIEVTSGRLRMDWTFSRRFHRRETIERLAHQYREELGVLIAHCVHADPDGRTPSDFPLVDLDQAEIDGLSRVLDDLDADRSRG